MEGGRVSDVSHLGAVIPVNERIVVHCSSPHLYHLSPLHSHREDLLPPLQQYDQFRQTAYLHCITHILTLHTITVSPSEMWRLYCKKLDIPCETHVVNTYVSKWSAPQQDVTMEDYHVLEVIGEGSFGRVYKGRRKYTKLVSYLFV